jgi:hypothetical protein
MKYRLGLERKDIIDLWQFLKSKEGLGEFDLLNRLEDFYRKPEPND